MDTSSFIPYFDTLKRQGFVVLPREVVGIAAEEASRMHQVQLKELDARFPGWRSVQEAAAAAQEAEVGAAGSHAGAAAVAEMQKALAGGFLGVQLMPEQLDLEFDPRVQKMFQTLFHHFGIQAPSDPVWVWLERSNVSFGQPMRSAVEQTGALPHIDANPWAEFHPPNVSEPYNADLWEPKVRVAGLHDKRPCDKDRPVQAFLALTDCQGGPSGGGMGMSKDRELFNWLRTETPPHGRNGHWGKLTRIYPKPGGQNLKRLTKAQQQEIFDRHTAALDALEYPSYRAGDVVMWMRETLHAGPKDNSNGGSNCHQGRLYLGGLPDNTLNRDAVRRQWEKMVQGKQAHGRACDRKEGGGLADLHALMTLEQRERAGETLFQSDPNAPQGADNESYPTDAQLFEVTPEAVGLGFKNGTAVLRLTPLGANLLNTHVSSTTAWQASESVFVKVGESESDCRFAKACSDLRAELGLASTVTAPVIKVASNPGLEIDWPGLAAKANPSWGAGVRRKLQKLLANENRGGKLTSGGIPILIARPFEGEMLSHAPERLLLASGGQQLLYVLLFRKYVGSSDTNSRNMLISLTAGDQTGGVKLLSVDETAASAEQLQHMAKKGLPTAQAMGSNLLGAARAALVSHPADTAAFIRRMRGLNLPEVITRDGRLLKVHANEPFNDASLETLESGNRDAIGLLATRLKLPVCSDSSVVKSDEHQSKKQKVEEQ